MRKSPGAIAAAGVLFFACAFFAKPAGIAVVLPFLIAASTCWVRAVLDVTGCDRPLVRNAVYASFSLRWMIAIALYCASFYRWPIGTSLQVGNGFWLFCMDALNYHSWAPQILDALSTGRPLPNPNATVDYYLVVAFIYGLFGSSPLTAIAINILAWTLATVLLLALFSRLRDRPAPLPVVLVILFWPAGFIWPTQLMKDALVFLFLVVAVAAASAMVDSRRFAGGAAAGYALLAMALVPVIRLRVYVGRMLLGGAAVSACVALLWMLRERRAWRSLLGSVGVYAVAYIGLIVILAPDPFVVFSPSSAGAPNAGVAPNGAWQTLSLRAARIRIVAVRVGESVRSGVEDYRVSLAGGFEVMGPSELGIMRQKFADTGGASAIDSDKRLGGWADAARLAPTALANALFAPFPWDVLRPRGITGIFRTLDVSESLLMFLLMPALIVGCLRLRRPDEWIVLAIAGGGLVALGFVITNLGTLVRLRAGFTLLFVGFASYGMDAYPTLLAMMRRRGSGIPNAPFNRTAAQSVERSTH